MRVICSLQITAEAFTLNRSIFCLISQAARLSVGSRLAWRDPQSPPGCQGWPGGSPEHSLPCPQPCTSAGTGAAVVAPAGAPSPGWDGRAGGTGCGSSSGAQGAPGHQPHPGSVSVPCPGWQQQQQLRVQLPGTSPSALPRLLMFPLGALLSHLSSGCCQGWVSSPGTAVTLCPGWALLGTQPPGTPEHHGGGKIRP